MSCFRARSVSVQVLDKEIVDCTLAGSPRVPWASEIARDWRDGRSTLVDVRKLDDLVETYLVSLDEECMLFLEISPTDVDAKALFRCLFDGVIAVQVKLRRASPLVQLCVVYGKSILGNNVYNVSSCLVAAVRRVDVIIKELGALFFARRVCSVNSLGGPRHSSLRRQEIASKLDSR